MRWEEKTIVVTGRRTQPSGRVHGNLSRACPLIIPCSHHRKMKVSFLHALYPRKILNITLFGLLYHFSPTPKNLSIFQEFPFSCLLSKCSSRCFSNLSLSPEDIVSLQPSGGRGGYLSHTPHPAGTAKGVRVLVPYCYFQTLLTPSSKQNKNTSSSLLSSVSTPHCLLVLTGPQNT